LKYSYMRKLSWGFNVVTNAPALTACYLFFHEIIFVKAAAVG